jgi:hypothetical protein
MGLPNSYTVKPGSLRDYFDAIVNAQPPERFTQRFLEGLGFSSNNDRLVIGILKDLGFVNTDGTPLPRYFAYLDSSQSPRVMAEAIREAYSDLFAVNIKANEMSIEDVKNKLKTLYQGKKTNELIARIASTFTALCELADFSAPEVPPKKEEDKDKEKEEESTDKKDKPKPPLRPETPKPPLTVSSLQYQIHIVLPDTKDEAVFDAIFKSLRTHLG